MVKPIYIKIGKAETAIKKITSELNKNKLKIKLTTENDNILETDSLAIPSVLSINSLPAKADYREPRVIYAVPAGDGDLNFYIRKETEVLDTPTNLIVNGEAVSWTPVTNAAGYDVFIDNDNIVECKSSSLMLSSNYYWIKIAEGTHEISIQAKGAPGSKFLDSGLLKGTVTKLVYNYKTVTAEDQTQLQLASAPYTKDNRKLIIL